MKGRDILSIEDFTKEEILFILECAKKIKKTPPERVCQGKVMASLFFEPSTRTRLSFESAMLRLGGETMGFSDGGQSSAKKGESLHDSIKVIGAYADVIVLRHPLEGSAKVAADATDKPVINAGDGANEHPTQTLLDLFTLLEAKGTLKGLNIAFVGDLKYGRTVHSLAMALKHFDNRLFFVSPPSLQLPQKITSILRDAGTPFSSHETIEEVIGRADVIYMTRIQEERFLDKMEYEKVKNSFHLSLDLVKQGKEDVKILHPLPRLLEIDRALDQTPHACYFTQAENGLYVRQALLSLVLG